VTRTPPAFLSIIDGDLLRIVRSASENTEVHLVGGALRDCHLELAGPDLDLVVANGGREFSSRLADRLNARLVLLGGDRFAAYRLVGADLVLDVWDRQGRSLLSDLERRDFTINAVALDLRDGKLRDPFRGMRDLETRLLRSVTDSSLESDPLRVLRLVRFALLLPGFSVDPHTKDLARAASGQLGMVAIERIREELELIIRRAIPTQALRLLDDLALIPQLWNLKSDNRLNTDALAATLAACERVEELCHRLIGRGPDRHKTLPRAILTRTQARTIASLAAVEPRELGAAPRPFLAQWGESWLEAAAISASLAAAGEERLESWLEQLGALIEAEGKRVLEPRPLLNGQEIQHLLGVPPGPTIGRLLQTLLDAQLRGEVTTRETAAQFLLESHTTRTRG
jgi:tRNA nucleotidyltransferase (CCA-adding enzyme)